MPSRLPLALFALVLAAAPAFGQDGLPANKRTTLGLYLSSGEAAAMAARAPDRVLFLDIRSRAEVQFVGVPAGIDAVVPFGIFADTNEWDDKRRQILLQPNPAFAAEVARRLAAKGLDKNATVILICRSGDRSSRAVDALARLGYTKVYSVTDGFEGDATRDGKRTLNGWKNAGLPCGYGIDKARMY